jgi:RHS repeat-associated protein
MISSYRSFVLILLLALSPAYLAAQVTTGTPPFGSFGGGPDVINLANLNSHIDIPILSKPGRGLNFTYDLTYDSSIWAPVTANGTTTWAPIGGWGWNNTLFNAGYLLEKTTITQTTCTMSNGHPGKIVTTADTFTYFDGHGTSHAFGARWGYYQNTCTGQNETLSGSATAPDGSGYTINVTGGTVNKLNDTAGNLIDAPIGVRAPGVSITDRNGNQITVNSSGVFKDTLGTTALTVSGTAPAATTFTYTTSSGSPAAYTMNYAGYTVATNFGVSGIAETKSTAAVSLVSSIVQPDGSQYSFTYEATPTTPASGACTPYAGTTCVTGRIASVTFPTGATIYYTYSGGNNGIFSDGSTAGLSRQTTDGTWTYVRTKGSLAASATVITAPKLSYDSVSNQMIAQFQGIYPTQSDVYQGAAPTFTSLPIPETILQSGNPLREVQTCYNSAAAPCPTVALTLPITQRTVVKIIGGPSKLTSNHTDTYNSLGLQTESDDYEYSATPPGTRLQQTLITYSSIGGSVNALPQTVIVNDSGGTAKWRQDIAYDGAAPTCVSGAPQHDDTDFPCTYTVRGNATSVTTYTVPNGPSGGIVKNFTYDSLGNLLTAQVNCCELKTWVYSASTDYAYPDSVTSGASIQLKTVATYDLHMGLPLTTTDPNNLETTFTYDEMGRPLTTIVGTNPAITHVYVDTGTAWTVNVCSPIQSTMTACKKTIMDSQGRTVTSQLLDGGSNPYSSVDTQYDALGRGYRVSNPYIGSAGYWTLTNFDALGRNIKTILQDGSVSMTSYTNNTATVSDPVGNRREGVTDALGRLTSVYEPDPSNGNGLTLVTTYSYNIFNQLTQVTQGSQTRSYVYDALARLNSVTTPESGTVCFGTYSGSTCQANGYDSWNNLVYKTDARGVVTNYLYDALNRRVGITYPTVPAGVAPMPTNCQVNGSNSNVCLGYGTSAASYNNGLPISVTDGTGTTSLTYNSQEQVTQRQKIIGATAYTTSYAFNFANEATQTTYPSGRVVLKNYDAVGRLCAVGATGSTCSTGTTYATGFTYNAAQQPTAFNYGNGVSVAFGYSPDRLQLSSLSYVKNSTTLFGLAYSYGTAGSNDGLISAITDNVQSGRSVSYTYDSLARLTSALTSGSTAYPQWGLSWAYDRYGNITAETITHGTGVPSSCLNVSTATNRVTGTCSSNTGFGYDSSGNMTGDGLNTMLYDGENRVTSSIDGSASGTYSYDGGGQRVKKIASSTTTVYIFSGSRVIAEYDNGAAPSAPSREYVYSGDTLLAKLDSAGTHYYHRDHTSNRLVTDSTGNVTEQLGHYPYGESWYNSTNDKLFFTSYERDFESGNDYAQARYNISRLGRFSSADPLSGSPANPQTLNRYSYVVDNPINSIDSAGLSPSVCRKDEPGVCGSGGLAGGTFGDLDSFFGGGGPGSVVLGYDIFDAIAGAPGTFLYTDMYGNINFGFSISLYQATEAYIDAQNQATQTYNSGSGKTGVILTGTGFQVNIQNLGVDTIVTGLIPELAAANYQGVVDQSVANMPPSVRATYESLLSQGLSPGQAVFMLLATASTIANASTSVPAIPGSEIVGEDPLVPWATDLLENLSNLYGPIIMNNPPGLKPVRYPSVPPPNDTSNEDHPEE